MTYPFKVKSTSNWLLHEHRSCRMSPVWYIRCPSSSSSTDGVRELCRRVTEHQVQTGQSQTQASRQPQAEAVYRHARSIVIRQVGRITAPIWHHVAQQSETEGEGKRIAQSTIAFSISVCGTCNIPHVPKYKATQHTHTYTTLEMFSYFIKLIYML